MFTLVLVPRVFTDTPYIIKRTLVPRVYTGTVYVNVRTGTPSFTDNVDTRSSLDAMRELVASSYTYVERRRQAGGAPPNRVLLKNAAVYVTGILKVCDYLFCAV